MDSIQHYSNLATTSPVSIWLVPLVFAIISYYQGYQYQPESRPIDVLPNNLRKSYDFIICGGGSAGIYLRLISSMYYHFKLVIKLITPA